MRDEEHGQTEVGRSAHEGAYECVVVQRRTRGEPMFTYVLLKGTVESKRPQIALQVRGMGKHLVEDHAEAVPGFIRPRHHRPCETCQADNERCGSDRKQSSIA